MNLIRTTALSLVLALGLHMAQAAPNIEDDSRAEALHTTRNHIKSAIQKIITDPKEIPAKKIQALQTILKQNGLDSAAFYLDANKRNVGQWILNKNTDALLGYLDENQLDSMIQSTSIFEGLYSNIFAQKTAAAREEEARVLGTKVLEGAGLAAGGAALDEATTTALRTHFETATKEKDEKIAELEADAKTHADKLRARRDEAERAQRETELLRAQLDQARTTHAQALADKEKEIEEADAAHTGIQDEQRRKIGELEGQITNLETQLTAAKADARTAVQDDLDTAQRELAAAQTKLTENEDAHKAEKTRLEKEKVDLRAERDRLQAELAAATARAAAPAGESLNWDDLEQAFEATTQNVTLTPSQQLALALVHNQYAMAQAGDTETMKEDRVRRIQQLEAEVEKEKPAAPAGADSKELENAREKIEAQKLAFEELGKQNAALGKEKAALEAEVAAQKQDLDTLRANVAAAAKTTQDTQTEVTQLKVQLAAQTQRLAQLEKVEEENAALKARVDEITELEDKLQELKTSSRAIDLIPTTLEAWELLIGKRGGITKEGTDFLKTLKNAMLNNTPSPSSPTGKGKAPSPQERGDESGAGAAN